jgi:hypothetical protein
MVDVIVSACTRLPNYADLLEAELVAEEVLALALHWITKYNSLESNSAKVIKLVDVKSPNLSHYVRRLEAIREYFRKRERESSFKG